MRNLASALTLLAATATFACSSDSGDDSNTGGQAGAAQGGTATGGTATGGSSGTAAGGTTGGTGAGGSGMGGTGAGGTDAGGTGGSGMAGSSGSGTAGSGGGGLTRRGICGQRAEATVDADPTFEGFEEFYMISEVAVDDGRTSRCLQEGGDDCFVCLIRFDVARAGEGEAGCQDAEAMACEWSHEVTFGNPQIITEVDGACAGMEFMWNQSWVDSIDGTQASYGFVDQYSGHDSVLMKYSDTLSSWQVYARATWDSMSGVLTYDNRLGDCFY